MHDPCRHCSWRESPAPVVAAMRQVGRAFRLQAACTRLPEVGLACASGLPTSFEALIRYRVHVDFFAHTHPSSTVKNIAVSRERTFALYHRAPRKVTGNIKPYEATRRTRCRAAGGSWSAGSILQVVASGSNRSLALLSPTGFST